jgi:hypothetical protein
MESIERVTAEIQPVPVAAETPADVGQPEPSVPEAGAPTFAEPLARLFESGVGFLRQIEAALPAETDPGSNGGRSTMRRIEARQDADGTTFLAVPMPSREAVTRFTDGLAALLRMSRMSVPDGSSVSAAELRRQRKADETFRSGIHPSTARSGPNSTTVVSELT